MKKIIVYILFFILIMFFIPILFTKKDLKNKAGSNKKEIDSINENTDDSNKELYNYKNLSKIKLLHTKTNKIDELDLDTYLIGVVSSEMPAYFENEALKAQAVVARTYTIYKVINEKKHKNANICDDPKCCQAWISKEDRFKKWNKNERESNWEKIKNAVDNTKGKIITYDGKPINAFFHSNSGGVTETAKNVWGGENYPYLQAVETSGEDAYKQYSSEIVLTRKEFVSKIKKYHSDFKIDFNKKEEIKILEYTDGGRVKRIKIGNLDLSGVEIRNIFNLKSANFKIEVDDKNIKFSVIGYGHGVGMSQTGADSMAKQGYNYIDIIKHYYVGIEISDV